MCRDMEVNMFNLQQHKIIPISPYIYEVLTESLKKMQEN